MTLPLVLGGIGCLLVAVLTLRDTLAGSHGLGATRNASRQLRSRGSRLERRRARHAAHRLGVDSPGLTIGRAGGRWLMQGWEDGSIDIAGPRMGKTTTRVIPAILEAPGAVIATSNKTDALDATRERRAEHGPVYVFAPQNLTHQPPALYWDPLSYVTDETRAGELADVFAAAVTDRDARSDGFFAPKGQKVVAALLLAAATAGRSIDQVYSWVVDPRDTEPVRVLRDHGYPLLGDSLAGEINSPESSAAASTAPPRNRSRSSPTAASCRGARPAPAGSGSTCTGCSTGPAGRCTRSAGKGKAAPPR